PTIIVREVKQKVVHLANLRESTGERFLNFGNNTGKISLLITAETVLESEAVMDSVFAKREARTNPTNPAGKNLITMIAYDKVGSLFSSKNKEAANMGKSNIKDHIKYSMEERIPAFLDSIPEEAEIKRVERFQVPPLKL